MSSPLPAGWEVRHSNSKNLPYYFNAETKESRWEFPSSTEGKIRAAHLLIKHKDSRRPKSQRQDGPITRTKEEAIEILKGHEGRIRAGETTLSETAKTESDCSSATKGGDLGYFGEGDMQRAFSKAAFALKPGEMSGVVETDSGVHLIERLG